MKFEGGHDNDRGYHALGVETYWGKVNPMFVRKHEHKYNFTFYIHLGPHMWNGTFYWGKIDKPV